MRPSRVLVLLVGLGVLAPAVTASAASATLPPQFVLSPEGNHLWAYETTSGERQLVIHGENAGEPGAEAPHDPAGNRDINGQICVSPDGRHIIAGEDTVFFGGSSHDPRIAGWGYFEIEGDALGAISATQVGKLAPEAQPDPQAPDYRGPGYTGDPDNQGCGFLDDRRLFTTAIGNTLPGEDANGQLFLWFGDGDRPATGLFEQGFRQVNLDADGNEVAGGDATTGFLVGEVDHCVIDDTLATAGGMTIDHHGDVYLATNRPDDEWRPGAVWKYSGTWPQTFQQCIDGDYDVTKSLVVPGIPMSPLEVELLASPNATTPSSVAISPWDTLFVSSVFTGTVSEFSKRGDFLRDIYPLSPVAPRTGPTGDTPFGLDFDRDGTLWIADLGIVGGGPAQGQGSLIRVPFDDRGVPGLPETVQDGLTFPDNLGIYTGVPASAQRPGPKPTLMGTTSEWGCDDWGMYGRTLSRQFSVSSDCATEIAPDTVANLTPAWTFRVPLEVDDQGTFTASPTVVDGVVYIGGWTGIMYALDLDSGEVLWEAQTPVAPGATYGPIISTAAVADVPVDGVVRRLVIFGSGPRIFALDAQDGSAVWVHYFGEPDKEDTPEEAQYAESQSSAFVHNGVVYIGYDVHNKDGDRAGGIRGGLLALAADTGEFAWRWEPEVEGARAEGKVGPGESLPPSGCGGIWGSPTLDTETGILYFGTANCPAVDDNQALPMEEITALRVEGAQGRPLASPQWLWTFRPHQQGEGPWSDEDEDFGATPNLFVDASGRKILGAGSKDGSYYALDPATGEVLWNHAVVTPVPNVGGFIGSPAVWEGRVFGGTAISYTESLPPAGLAMHAFDAAGEGAVLWHGASAPTYAASAVANGVVFNGALDTTLKAFDADTGAVLWASPSLGAISSGAIVVGDMVLVGSGTSTSDACAKDNPTDEACVAFFDAALSQQGGIHAFRLPSQDEG